MSSFLQCFDESGNIDGIKFLRYRIERRNGRERGQRKRGDGRVPPNEERSRKYVRNREKSEEEKCYKDYVSSDRYLNRRTSIGRQFRALVQQARDENWFPPHNEVID